MVAVIWDHFAHSLVVSAAHHPGECGNMGLSDLLSVRSAADAAGGRRTLLRMASFSATSPGIVPRWLCGLPCYVHVVLGLLTCVFSSRQERFAFFPLYNPL